MSSVQLIETRLRHDYLGNTAQKGMRLPPVRNLARQYAVSSATIAKALKTLEFEGLVNAVHGSGVYIADTVEGIRTGRCLTVASTWTDFRNMSENLWGSQFNQAIFRAAARHERSISLLPFDPEKSGGDLSGEELKRRLVEMSDVADVLLYMPVGREEYLAAWEAFRRAEKPAVSYHPVSRMSTSNFVSIDHLASASHVARALTAAGRKRLLFVFVGSLPQSYSASLQYLGLQSTLMEAGGAPLEVLVPQDATQESARLAVGDWLKKHGHSLDAVVAAGDGLALGAREALLDAGLDVPGEVSVVCLSGGRGPDARNVDLSAMLNPFDEIAERLIDMVVRRAEPPFVDVPGEHVTLRPHCGRTTREVENELLRDAESQLAL